MAEIREVVSERLQATIRRLLPSQRGFTEDLQASNVITPIIDLTPSAEGSILPYELQTCLSFGVDPFNVGGTTSDIITNAGFFRVQGSYSMVGNQSQQEEAEFYLDDGSTTKKLYGWRKYSTATFSEFFVGSYDFVVFLRSGDKLTAETTSHAVVTGSTRQIADLNGVLTDPSGFLPQ